MADIESGKRHRILLVEDDPGLQRQMRWALAPYETSVASSRAEALKQFRSRDGFKIVILDLGLPPDENGITEGLKTLEDILTIEPQTKIIVASGHTDRLSAVKAVATGAFDFFGKPVEIDVLKLIIERAQRMYELEEENRSLRESASQNSTGLVFGSAKMAEVQRLIERVGPSDVSVLIAGETGTGKEVVARALHNASPRRSARFVAINCASIPENLLESELFGHERGAFTGAIKLTQGKFELAHKGTLFLDEIGDMPLALQAKLLRFLQNQQFERVGGRVSISVDVRLISATNRPLEKLIAERGFREDLFYRLNQIRIELPALREREADPVLLAQHFLNVFGRSNQRQFVGLGSDAVAAISGHNWPGNVRELENRMKRAVVMAEGKLISASDLDLAAPLTGPKNLDLHAEIRKLEWTLVQQALNLSEGNVSKAAKLLRVSRPYLYNLMKSRQVVRQDEQDGGLE
jgi:two-component system, NtrC family, response regulator